MPVCQPPSFVKSRTMENFHLVCGLCRIGLYTLYKKLCCKKDAVPRPEFAPVCLGLGGAGKSTMLAAMSNEDFSDIPPTTGFNIKAVMLRSAILNIKEIGGGEKVRPFWKHYYQGAEAIVFVVDSSCGDDELDDARDALQEALQHPALRGLPCLVIANFQDKENARTAEQMEHELDLKNLCYNRKYIIQPGSLKDIEMTRHGFDLLNDILTTPAVATHTSGEGAQNTDEQNRL